MYGIYNILPILFASQDIKSTPSLVYLIMSPFSSSSASSIPQLFERLQDLLSAREIVQFSDDEDVQMDSVQKKKSKFYLYENVLNIKVSAKQLNCTYILSSIICRNNLRFQLFIMILF